MYQNLLEFLGKGLGEDSKAYLFLESFLGKLGENNFTFILVIISLVIISFIIFQLFRGRYLKIKKGKRYKTYGDYLEGEKYKIALYLIISAPFIILFFVRGLGLNVLDYIVSWSSYDGENYPGLAILFGYNLDSTIYGYYNIGRYALLIIIFFFTIYTGIMHYTIGARTNYSGKEIKYEPLFTNGIKALAIIIVLLFSTLVDGSLNWIMSFFSDQSLHDLIIGGTEL